MSITTDLKSYVDQTVATAQAGLSDVADSANEFVGKYRDNVTDIAATANGAFNDVRASAEKAINADALRTAIEPYVAQAREYGTAVTDRAEDLLGGMKDDPRLGKLVAAATAASEVVLAQLNTYVVKPVSDLTGVGAKPKSSTSARPKPAKAATTKPASARSTSKPASARSTSASKSATKSASGARKSTARKTTSA